MGRGRVSHESRGTQIDGVTHGVSQNVPIPTEHGVCRRESAAEWVARVWRDVLEGTPVPFFVAPHDYWQSFDVLAGRWVGDADLYS
jgi:hypothetical protein